MNDGLPNNYDAWKLATPWDDETKCECEKCQEHYHLDDLTETTSRKMLCEYCIEDLPQCDCCDMPIDNDQSWDNESCDSCNESKGDTDFDMER